MEKKLDINNMNGITEEEDKTCGPVSYTHLDVYKRQLLHRELGLPMTEITKAGGDSKLVVGTNKDRI